MKKAPAKMKKTAMKMAKKSPARKPEDLEVGNRKNLPPDLKAKISAAKMKKMKASAMTMKKAAMKLKKESAMKMKKSGMMMKKSAMMMKKAAGMKMMKKK